ncbi:hypothetical protein MHYP_G00330400 [Metynnis hypsauchen]
MTSGHKERPSVKFYWGYNSRMNVTWKPTNNSICLTIKNINESDEGFYFCTVGDGILTTPGTGHILKLEALVIYSALACCVFWMCCMKMQKGDSYTAVSFTSEELQDHHAF